jgi:hypothetical protein
MTYKQGCKYAGLLGIPCLVFALVVRLPPLYHMAGARRLAQIVLFPGWQVIHWITGGLIARNFEYKVLMPVFIIVLNVFAWGGLIWLVGNMVEGRPTRRGHSRREA